MMESLLAFKRAGANGVLTYALLLSKRLVFSHAGRLDNAAGSGEWLIPPIVSPWKAGSSATNPH